MKLHRFLGDFKLSGRIIKIIDKETVDQIRRVLRLGAGDKIVLADGQRREAIGEINEMSNAFLAVKILERKENLNEPIRRWSKPNKTN